DWAVPAKWGTALTKADVSAIYFYAAATETGSNWLTLSTASSTQIAWLDSTGTESTTSTNSTIRVKLGSNTSGHAADNQFFECRAKFTDGSYLTLLQGRLHIKASQVDRP